MTTEAIEPEIRVLKEATCPSNSGKSNLTYQIGCDEKEQLHLHIFANSGNGYFSSEWVTLKSILALLEDRQGPITGYTLQPLFQGKSINTSYFLLAALKQEGLVEPWKRVYNLTDSEAFRSKMKALLKDALKAAPPKKKSPASSKKNPSKPAPTPL